MLIAGAGGHAKEVLGVVYENNEFDNIYLFDEFSTEQSSLLFNKFKILSGLDEVKIVFEEDNRFVIGVGNPLNRELLKSKLESLGGKLVSAISSNASVGNFNTNLSEGLNIMPGSYISNDVNIELGSLIHVNVTLHHDVKIGKYCELSPGCIVLGNTLIGDYCSVGAGAVILPNIKIGNNVIVGAGAVVTKNVKSNTTVVGVPAKEC